MEPARGGKDSEEEDVIGEGDETPGAQLVEHAALL
jgi:hypothetical protein